MSVDSKLKASDGLLASSSSDADIRAAMASQQLVIHDLVTQVATLTTQLPLLDVFVQDPVGFPTASSKGSSPLRHKPVPVEFDRFHGDVPEAWVFQADCYFDFYGIIE